MFRLFLAFLLAPLLASATRGLIHAPSYVSLQTYEFAEGALRASLPIYLFALPLGIAAFAFTWSIGRIGLLSAIATGAAIAVIFFIGPVSGIVADEKLNDWYKTKVLVEAGNEVLFGAWVGAIAWVLGVWRNGALWVRRKKSVVSQRMV